MSYLEQGYNKYLSKAFPKEDILQEFDPLEVDQIISELSGT